MRKQPRDTNNPTNPLYKVASLEIKRKNERAGKRKRSLDVLVTLNFKKSHDVGGSTTDSRGREVAVTFTMAIRRGALDVSASLGGAGEADDLSISNVAFIDGLATDRIVQVNEQLQLTGETGYTGSADATVDLVNLSGSLKAKAGGKLSKQRKSKKSASSSTKYRVTGISATHAGNIVNWSVDSLWTRQEGMPEAEQGTYLLGEVFRDPVSQEAIRACRITWDRGQATPALEIHGSVRVMTHNLIIENITFSYADGQHLGWSDIRKLDSNSSPMSALALDREAFRRRLVVQVIKKFLQSLNMRLDGASLEICSARG